MDPRHRPPTTPTGPPPAGRWVGPPVDLFPSRVYNNNNNSSSSNNHYEVPQINTIPASGGPPVGAFHSYSPVQPQEAFRSPRAPPADLSPSSVPSWECMPPPMSSAPDRLLGPPSVGAPNPASESKTTREWLEVTAYQPVDIVTRTVEVPVTRTVDVYVPKPVIKEKIVEVPKLVPKYIEKIVEVPQVEWVERVVEVPEVIYKTKIVPKVEIRENIVEKPVFIQKWVEKVVEVSVVEEVIRYRTIHEPEEIIKYIPQGRQEEEWRGAPILTVPPHQTPELPPKWGSSPQSSPRTSLVKALPQQMEHLQ
ncbi:inner membrane complex associated protein 4, putative [Eimeria brunetti]|uniref:Inner membrane complex associated protein 4, putative n=1 Tax=Eimeria brunetti TaxID=51314 RepID=U6LWT2_9EIME|nr:inner membrane complex associated protein 4, putative [Eimeria brunetti]